LSFLAKNYNTSARYDTLVQLEPYPLQENALRPAQFSKNAPGRVVRSTLGHWTFDPLPLPPRLSFDLPLIRILTDSERALGQLSGVGQLLPNPHLLIRPFLRREAVLSSRIEGTLTKLDQLFLFESKADEIRHPADVEEVSNYVRALELGIERIRAGQPLTLRLIRELHKVLMENVRGADKRPGEFRQCGVLIGSTGSFEQARFIPPCHTALDPLLRDFERFLNLERSLPIVVQLALVHYQFETIHPFTDGNGRLGRLLITLMLCEREALREPLLYLSAYFEEHGDEYRDHLLAVSRKGAWNEWIGFFARGVAEQANDASMRVQQLLDLWDEYRQLVVEVSKSAAGLRLLDELFASPVLTVTHAADFLGMTFKAAQNHIDKLVKAGVIQEASGKKKNRYYVARRIMALLDEPVTAASRAEPN
jgi:Fic family protein